MKRSGGPLAALTQRSNAIAYLVIDIPVRGSGEC